MLVPVAFAYDGTFYSGLTTLTLQNGTDSYTGCEDTFINSSAADSGKNYGAADTLFLSGAANASTWHPGINTVLMQWDVSDLPDSAIITRARLFLFQSLGATGSQTDSLVINRLPQYFDEGTGTGTASSSSATWHTRGISSIKTGGSGNWHKAGADSASAGTNARQWVSQTNAVDATMTGSDTISVDNAAIAVANDYITDAVGLSLPKTGVGANNQRGWVAWEVTKYVRGANSHTYDLNANIVSLLIRMHNNANNKLFSYISSEYATTAYRPKLVIEYFDPTTVASGSSRRTIGHRTKGGVN